MKGLCCATLSVALLLTAPTLAQVLVIDGTADALYGAPAIVQDTQTGFGDSNLGLVGQANGSELDCAYAYITNCTLYLVFAGNLESNNNKLEIFFDTRAGGQNRLLDTNPNVDFNGLNRMGGDGVTTGLKFDSDFSADFWFSINGNMSGTPPAYAMFANYAELRIDPNHPGIGYFLGTTTAASNGTLTGGTNPFGVLATINNSNTGGVTGGFGLDFGGGGVTTGIEIAIPLQAIGLPSGPIKICAFVNGQAHDFVSNQTLAGIAAAVPNNLGDPRAVDLSSIPGNQYFTVNIPGGCGACCNGTSCSIKTQAQCSTGGGSFIGAGVPCLSSTCTGFPTGACCVGGACQPAMTQADCTAAGGEYLGNDSVCTATICNTGACCIAQTCSIKRDADCTAQGGTYFGDGSTCSPNPCTSGACCFGPSCVVTSPATCAAQAGTYKGDGTTCGTNPCNAPAGTPIIDGQLDASYGAPLIVQDTETGFGDASDGLVDIDNTGSELDAVYAKVVGDRLFLFLAGNLQSNGNKLDMFFDTGTPGQNQLLSTNPSVDFGSLQRMGADPNVPGSGLMFDSNFAATYYMNVVNTVDTPTVAVFVNYAQLFVDPNHPGVGIYLGEGRAANFTNGGLLPLGGTNTFGVLCTLNNSNVAGVVGGFSLAVIPPENPADVTTGVELSIPLSAFGNPSGSMKGCVFVNGIGHDFLSNQVLGPIGAFGGNNLGDPRAVNFSAIPGNQYFTIALPPAFHRGDTNCDGGVNFGDINPFVAALSGQQAWKNVFPGGNPPAGCTYVGANDINCDGNVNFADINPFVACLSGGCPNCP